MGRELERQLMEEVESRQRSFFDSFDGHRLRGAAIRFNPAAFYNCFFIKWIPGQTEDNYLLLVDANDLMKFSIDRQSREIVLEDREVMPPRWQARGWGDEGRMVQKLAREKRAALLKDAAKLA